MNRTVEINGNKYHFKFALSVVGKLLRKHNISLSEINNAINDNLLLAYELIYESVKYAHKREGVDFKFIDDYEGFTYELDDDPGAIERSMTLVAESQMTGDESVKKKKAVKK